MKVDAVLVQFRELYRRVVIEAGDRLGTTGVTFEEMWRDLANVGEYQKVERLVASRFADLRAEPAFRQISDHLLGQLGLNSAESPRESKIVAICSWGEEEGRSTLAFNFARDFAMRHGLRVALIDYDFPNPRMKELLRLTPIYGVRELIEQRAVLTLRDVAVLSRADRIMLVPAIGGYPRNAKRAEGVGGFLQDVLRETDVAVLDTPRFVENDFTVLALCGLVHGVVLLKSRVAPRMEFQAMIDRFVQQKAPLLGYIENLVP